MTITVDYTIVAYDVDTREYLVSFTHDGESRTVLVPAVHDPDNQVDETATRESIDATILAVCAPTPAITGTASLVGTTGTSSNSIE